MELKIYTCEEWGAKPPRHPITAAGRPQRVIDHHTAGHAPRLDASPTESLEEAKAYARAIQNHHMSPDPHDPSKPWSDTGQNFLVSRSGHVLEGRHGSLRAISSGRMVVSAHCPGQNSQPGIEHEHFGTEDLTPTQQQASIALHAFICRHTGIRPTEFYPHKHFFPTECPSPIVERWLPELKRTVAHELGVRPHPAGGDGGGGQSTAIPPAFLDWVQWKLGLGVWRGHRGDPHLRPRSAPRVIPKSWWEALKRLTR